MRRCRLLCPVALVLLATTVPGLARGDHDDALPFGPPQRIGQLADSIIESSGLARSWRYHNAYWTHNDSGNPAELFLVAANGKTLATVAVSDATAVDWEDLCSFQYRNASYLLIGDVGDNGRRRSHVTLHLVAEPDLAGAVGKPARRQPVLGSVNLRYADGPRDCEAVAVDTKAGRIYLFTKTVAARSAVYTLPLATLFQASEEPAADTPLVAKLDGNCAFPLITGADISADGTRLVCVNYSSVRQWQRTSEQTWKEVYGRQPATVDCPGRRQGEAVCYGQDDRSVCLSSEGGGSPLWYLPAQ